ncbi:MAG: hypothetical protein U5K79_24190 [Cyclobacteriaceae bacterium]|nr:hypothetical protein [Cyclobacteriaceae bacterium]
MLVRRRRFRSGQLADEQAKASKLTGPVIKVDPPGLDDTENLVQAFADAKAAGLGATVQLNEGTYYIDFILVKEFSGTFNGAGMGKTIIKPVAWPPLLWIYYMQITNLNS